jgi:SAM-dependent methyltransferase
MTVAPIVAKSMRWLRRTLRRHSFENRQFWNARYIEEPDKGSGPGSRGNNIQIKGELIRSTIESYGIRSVLDIGCGDLATLGTLDVDRYVGLDISDVIIERNKACRPEWQFICADLAGAYRPSSADLVLCFDVLIHQKTRQAYEAILSKALSATQRVALISGYSHPAHGWKVFFHEPIGASLTRLCPQATITRVAEYRATDVFRIVR